MAVIRKAGLNDLPALRALAISIFKITFESSNNPNDFKSYMDEAFSEEKVNSEFYEAGSQFFVAMECERMIGYARLRENPEANHLLGVNTIELQRMYVDIPFQGKGIANQLMSVCENFSRDHKKDWLWLGVWEHNPKAQHFYQKLGYEKFSEHRFMLGNDPQTDWLMRKWMGEVKNVNPLQS